MTQLCIGEHRLLADEEKAFFNAELVLAQVDTQVESDRGCRIVGMVGVRAAGQPDSRTLKNGGLNIDSLVMATVTLSFCAPHFAAFCIALWPSSSVPSKPHKHRMQHKSAFCSRIDKGD